MIDELHAFHFHVVPHVVIRSRSVTGRSDPFDRDAPMRRMRPATGTHIGRFFQGVDGWWPDEGTLAEPPVCPDQDVLREPQLDRPYLRPYALHRNGYAGMQRYAAFLWSGGMCYSRDGRRLGDAQVPVAINTSPDRDSATGARTSEDSFRPTSSPASSLRGGSSSRRSARSSARTEPTLEACGRPWGWNPGGPGPNAIRSYSDAASHPDSAMLHNPAIEPICKQYLELRYRLMPYLYTVGPRGCHDGLPIMRRSGFIGDDDRGGRSGGRISVGSKHSGGSHREGAVTRMLTAAGSGTTSGLASRWRAGEDRPARGPRDAAALRSGRFALAHGPVKQYTREDSRRPSDPSHLPGLMAASCFTRMTASRSGTAGRLDGDRYELGRSRPPVVD